MGSLNQSPQQRHPVFYGETTPFPPSCQLVRVRCLFLFSFNCVILTKQLVRKPLKLISEVSYAGGGNMLSKGTTASVIGFTVGWSQNIIYFFK